MVRLLQLEPRCLILSLCLYLLQLTHGSVIEFTASPSEVKEGLTSSVTLRCSLNDTADSSAVIGRRDVTRTQDNMASVTSIIVMKNGQDVAVVSHTHPAQQVGGNSSLQVTGSVAGSLSGRGFLELTLQDPAPSDTGEFQCQVNGESHTGHVVTFSTTVEVITSSPTTADLVKYIRESNQEINHLKEVNQVMKQEMKVKEDNMTRRISELENKAGTVSLFSVGLTQSKTLPIGQAIVYDKTFANIGNEYNTASGEFVCRVAGYYQFTISAVSRSAHSFRLDLQHNQKPVIAIYEKDDTSDHGSSNSVVIKLSSGDKVRVVSYGMTSYVYNLDPHRIYTTFTGHLVAML